MVEFAISIAAFVLGWLIYTGLLWALIKLQRLNYNLPGLFASSFAAALAAKIPFVGSYLSYTVLILCLWKCTHADIAPDLIFTVVISGALMFCVNLYVIGTLLGDLRPDLAMARGAGNGAEHGQGDPNLDAHEDDEPDEPEALPGEGTASVRSNRVPAGTVLAVSTPGEPAGTTNVSLTVHFRSLGLKGIVYTARRPEAMFSENGKIRTVVTGDFLKVAGPDGTLQARVEEIARTHVVLLIEGGDKVKIYLR